MRYYCSESKNSKTIVERFIEMCETRKQIFLAGPKGSEFNLLLKEYCDSFKADPSIMINLQITMMEESVVSDVMTLLSTRQQPSIVAIETRANFDEVNEKRLLRFLNNPSLSNVRFFVLMEDFDPFDENNPYPEAVTKRAKESLFMLPPLRERLADVSYFAVQLLNHGDKPNTLKFAKDAIELMLSYTWPGNYEELANVISVLLVGGNKNGVISRRRLEETINLSRTTPI
jgi:hypothetical protein